VPALIASAPLPAAATTRRPFIATPILNKPAETARAPCQSVTAPGKLAFPPTACCAAMLTNLYNPCQFARITQIPDGGPANSA
jgi:hypothetical protein